MSSCIKSLEESSLILNQVWNYYDFVLPINGLLDSLTMKLHVFTLNSTPVLTLCCVSNSFVSNIYFQFQVKISDFRVGAEANTLPLVMFQFRFVSLLLRTVSVVIYWACKQWPPLSSLILTSDLVSMCNRSQALDTLCVPTFPHHQIWHIKSGGTWRKKKEIKIIIGVDSFGGSYNDHEYFSFQLGNLRQLWANFWQASSLLNSKTLKQAS